MLARARRRPRDERPVGPPGGRVEQRQDDVLVGVVLKWGEGKEGRKIKINLVLRHKLCGSGRLCGAVRAAHRVAVRAPLADGVVGRLESNDRDEKEDEDLVGGGGGARA